MESLVRIGTAVVEVVVVVVDHYTDAGQEQQYSTKLKKKC